MSLIGYEYLCQSLRLTSFSPERPALIKPVTRIEPTAVSNSLTVSLKVCSTTSIKLPPTFRTKMWTRDRMSTQPEARGHDDEGGALRIYRRMTAAILD